MSDKAILAWRNLVWGSTLSSTKSWETDAPLDELKTPQIARFARRVDDDLGLDITVTFPEPSRVRLIGLLNHNLVDDENIAITLFNSSNDPIGSDFTPDIWVPPNDGFVRHLFVLLPSTINGVKSFSVTSLMHPDHPPFQCGGIWASTAFNKPIDARMSLNVDEMAQSVTSDENETRAGQRSRMRILSFSVPALTESDASGITGEGNRSAILHEDILDMLMYSCKSRPIIAIPRTSTPERMHKYGVYGYMQGNLPLNLESTGADVTPNLSSAGQITVRESL